MTDFKPMLAKDANLAKLRFPLYVQPKFDGIRCLIKDGRPVSRTLKTIPNLEIQNALSDSRLEGLDGELIVGDPTASGCMQRTTSFVMAAGKIGEPWAFYVFDKWDHVGSWESRLSAAYSALSPVAHARVMIVPAHRADSHDRLEALEDEYVTGGWEGVIVRVPDAPYKFGRSGSTGPLLKIKRFIDFEALVVDVYEEQHNGNEARKDAFGRTERSSHQANKTGKGTLGGVVCEAINGPWAGVTFRCGTGFTAGDRAALWVPPEAYAPPGSGLLGKVVKIKAFEVGAKDKPRFPTFLGFRNMEVDG